LKKKNIYIIENRSEIGAGTRGASLGIDAIKIASLNAGSDYFRKHPIVEVENENYLLFDTVETPSALRIKGVSRIYESLVKHIKECFDSNGFPIVIAGDHSSAGGTIAGLKIAHPEKRLGVIWIDAHGDLHSPFTSPTGNVHGMPLATALGEDNLACRRKEVSDTALKYWDELKNIGGIKPKVNPEDIIMFGVRDTEEPEDLLMERLGIRNYTVKECREKGIDNCVSEALVSLEECDWIYLSFDVDSMDCETVSYGTGTPVKNGFQPKEAEKIILKIIESGKVACLEVVEVNPTLDNKQNLMAETTFKILENSTSHLEKYSL
jgi:arginase